MLSGLKDVVDMEDLENWLREILKQKETDETTWFLNRPSLRTSRLLDHTPEKLAC